MSGLLGSILGRPKGSELAGFKVQTSLYGVPIPIVYGWTRIPGNLIHMPHQPEPTGDAGGKLGRVTKGSNSGNNYAAPAILALCEGEITGIGWVWRDKDDLVDFTTHYAPDGWDLSHLGTIAQAPWTFLTSDYPAEAVPYQFTAYLANEAMPFPNDSMSQYSWEVKGLLSFGGGIVDASVADVIPDLLTNERYGAGWSSAQLGDLTDAQDYCAAAGLFVGMALDNQRPAADWINDLCEIGNLGLVWSDGKLKLIPYGDTALTGNGHTFTPNTTPVYDLGDGDFLAPEGTDPIVVTRKDPSKAYNQVQVQYRDRGFSYNPSTYTAQDQYAIEQYGLVPMGALQMPGIVDHIVAQPVAQVRLQREQNIRNTYAFRLGWKFSLLEPMDLVTLTDVGLGLNLTPVRITEMTETPDENGFDCLAEDWPLGTASATLYPSQAASGSATNANVDPGDTVPLIFDGPSDLSAAPLEIWIGASGGDAWGGCDVYLSVDNVSFDKVGTIRGKAIFGVTTATLATNAAYPSIDTTHTLSVNLTASGGALVAQSQANFDNLTPICYLGGHEFVDYRDLALTSAFHYNLTHLYRGLFGSTPSSHASATDFIFCDQNVLRVQWPLGYIGQVLYFKFTSFNIYGAAMQDLATVSSVSHTVGQDPLIPGNSDSIPQGTISIDGSGNWSATIDGPGGTGSIKLAVDFSAFPSDATVIAQAATNLRTVTVSSGSPISLGTTVYISAIAYTGAGGTGTASASAHIRGTYGAAPAIPQGTVGVEVDGYWGATADGPEGTNSFRWLSSTSAFPADATVIASGTVVGSARTFSVTHQGPLTFGDTVYVTVVAFTDASGLVGPSKSIHLRGTYQSYENASKTASFSPMGFVIVPSQSTVPSFGSGGGSPDGALWNDALPTVADNTRAWMFPVVPNGVTITEVLSEIYNSTVDTNGPAVNFGRIESNTIVNLSGWGGGNAGLGWQAFPSFMSESTTGRSYQLFADFNVNGVVAPVLAGSLRIGNIYITYTSPNIKATL